MASNDRNPTNSSILQALLDVEDAGFKTQLEPVIAKLQSDKKLLQDLETRFQQRGYNQDKIKYTQLTIDERLVRLSNNATNVLLYLGMFCSQNGLVSIKLDELATATACGSKDTARRAVKQLMDNGLLVEIDGKRRHEPPVWQVHPGVIHSGKRMTVTTQVHDFMAKVKPGTKNLFREELPLVTQQDSIYRKLPDGSKVYFMHLHLVPQAEKEPSDTGTMSEGPRVNSRHNNSKAQQGGQDEQLPGQMDIYDYGL